MQKGDADKSQVTDNTRKKFFGNMLQILRTCSVNSGLLGWDGDPEGVSRLLRLEEQHLHKWVNRYSVLVELYRRAQAPVSAVILADKAKADERGLLLDLVGNDALESVATETLDYLLGIPYKYEYWAHLRGIVGLNLSEAIPISDILTLTRIEDIPKPEGLVGMMAVLGSKRDFTPAALKLGDTVLHIRASGYSSRRVFDSAPAFALSIVKEFVALSEAFGVLEVKSSSPDWTTTGLLTELPHEDSSNWVSDIPLQVLKHVDKYCIDEQMTQRRTGLLDLTPGQTIQRTEEEIRAAVIACLATIGRVFGSDADKHAIAIRTAAQWYFDAMADNNETNSFIFTSLGLEALLGGTRSEAESVGVKKLLGNRLAYLLGGRRSERERLVEEFIEFYDIRSAIVHGREPRLSYSSILVLFKGKYWLKHALRKELRLF